MGDEHGRERGWRVRRVRRSRQIRRLSRVVSRALLLLAGSAMLASCNALRAPPWESARADPPAETTRTWAAAGPECTAAEVRSTAELREAGPAYVVYDQGPILRQSDRLTGLLEEHLLPVIEAEDLPLRTASLFWVLIRTDGTVADVQLHSSSPDESFDRAAEEVAGSLQYEPARRCGQPIPVWVLSRVHLRMP